jgi:hypothetical protein
MATKQESTLLTGVAKKIGSTLGVVAAEANRVVRPWKSKASSMVSEAKPRARRMARTASAWVATRSTSRKRTSRKRTGRRSSKARSSRH